MASCNGASNQQWLEVAVTDPNLPNADIFSFENTHSSLCLTGGGSVFSVSCNGQKAQEWVVIFANNVGRGWFQVLQDASGGLCLEIAPDGKTLVEDTCAFPLGSATSQDFMLN
jgi:hypothetical protein